MLRRFHTIHSRLFLLFLFSMLSILLIVSLLYYKRSTDQLHQKIGEIAQKNASQTVQLFNLLLQGYDSLSKSVSGNFDLLRLLDQSNQSPAVKAINERTINDTLSTIYYSREDVIGIHVMSYTGSLFSYEQKIFNIIAQVWRKNLPVAGVARVCSI